jgi:hypothetical protein
VYTFGYQNAMQQANDIAIGSFEIIVVGNFQGVLAFGSQSVTCTSNGGGFNAFRALLGSDGTVYSLDGFGDSNESEAEAVAILNSAGDYAISGGFAGNIDLGGGSAMAPSLSSESYLVVFDMNNTYKWSSIYNGSPLNLGVDLKGNIVLAGLYSGSIDFDAGALMSPTGDLDLFLTKLDPSGNELWAKSFDGGKLMFGRMRVLPTGEEVVAGAVTGPVNFGTGVLTPPGMADAFVAKFGF